MADKSKIEWTDATWGPIRARCWEVQNDGSGKERLGWHCVHVSEGCRNCYAERINRRLGTGFDYKPGVLRGRRGYHGGGTDRPELFLDEKMLLAPLRWRKQRRVFVCSMTDLFLEDHPDEWIDAVFAIMALCPQHTFQVLTKRAARMSTYIREQKLGEEGIDRADGLYRALGRTLDKGDAWPSMPWPLPNVWLGVSVEDQPSADARIPHLLSTPAAVRFVSAEPLLGPIELTNIQCRRQEFVEKRSLVIPWFIDALSGVLCKRDGNWPGPAIDWVIVGGESGPGARPMHPDWARSLRDQCRAAGVPFFFKQWGEWLPWEPDQAPDWRAQNGALEDGHTLFPAEMDGDATWDDGLWALDGTESHAAFQRVGRARAGRLLNGVEHNGFPDAADRG